jgi:hypothetical protein
LENGGKRMGKYMGRERDIYIYGEKSGEDSGMKYMNMIISTIFVLGDLNTNLIF